MVIEIFSNNDRLIEAYIEFAVKILSLNLPIDKYNYRSGDGYEVEFVPRNAYVSRGFSKLEQINLNLRKNEIKELLENDAYNSKNVISLIDIEAFHISSENEIQNQDPKKIIRSAFKDKGIDWLLTN